MRRLAGVRIRWVLLCTLLITGTAAGAQDTRGSAAVQGPCALPSFSPAERSTPASRWIVNRRSDTVIVFVHGVNSTWYDTWYGEKRSDSTSRLPVHAACKSAGGRASVYMVAYLAKTALAQPYNELVSTLLTELQNPADDEESILNRRVVVFVGHSLGGILVRSALTRAWQDGLLSRAAIGVLILGSPALGSKMASHGLKVGEILKLRSFENHPQLRFLAPSEHGGPGEALADAVSQFNLVLNDPRTPVTGKTFCESSEETAENPLLKGGMLVLKVLAGTNFTVVPIESCKANQFDPVVLNGYRHSDLARPTLAKPILEAMDSVVASTELQRRESPHRTRLSLELNMKAMYTRDSTYLITQSRLVGRIGDGIPVTSDTSRFEPPTEHKLQRSLLPSLARDERIVVRQLQAQAFESGDTDRCVEVSRLVVDSQPAFTLVRKIAVDSACVNRTLTRESVSLQWLVSVSIESTEIVRASGDFRELPMDVYGELDVVHRRPANSRVALAPPSVAVRVQDGSENRGVYTMDRSALARCRINLKIDDRYMRVSVDRTLLEADKRYCPELSAVPLPARDPSIAGTTVQDK